MWSWCSSLQVHFPSFHHIQFPQHPPILSPEQHPPILPPQHQPILLPIQHLPLHILHEPDPQMRTAIAITAVNTGDHAAPPALIAKTIIINVRIAHILYQCPVIRKIPAISSPITAIRNQTSVERNVNQNLYAAPPIAACSTGPIIFITPAYSINSPRRIRRIPITLLQVLEFHIEFWNRVKHTLDRSICKYCLASRGFFISRRNYLSSKRSLFFSYYFPIVNYCRLYVVRTWLWIPRYKH